MKKRQVAAITCVAVVLFVLFVPVVWQKGFDFRCYYGCLLNANTGYEASIAFAFLNTGAVYDETGYHFILFGASTK